MTRRQMLGLVALSLLASAAWLVDDLLPVEGSPMAGQGFRLLVCSALTLCVLAVRRSARSRVSRLLLLQVATVSLGLLAIAFMMLSAARGRIASGDGVLVFALMPVATMLMATGEHEDLTSLWPALLGAAGVMILLPLRVPTSGEEMLGAGLLVGAMLLSSGCIIWLHRLLRGVSLRAAVPAICMLNGLLLSMCAGNAGWTRWNAATFWTHSLRATLFDLPEMVLMVWLLKTLSPQRLAGRYLIAPLFTVVEGLFLVRPHFDVRTCAGLGLLAAGAALMVFGRTAEPSSLQLKLR